MLEKIKKYKIPIIIILTLIILIITLRVITTEELIIDTMAYNLFVEKLRSPNLNKVMLLVATLSNTPVTVIFIIVLLILIKDKKKALTIPANLLLITIINQILKLIIQRPRPIGYRLIEIGEYSFPSGHAMTSMALYGFLIYLSYKLIKNKNLKIFFITACILIIIIIGISRIYLGVHYCSDVLAGWSISIIYLIIYINILKNHKIIP